MARLLAQSRDALAAGLQQRDAYQPPPWPLLPGQLQVAAQSTLPHACREPKRTGFMGSCQARARTKKPKITFNAGDAAMMAGSPVASACSRQPLRWRWRWLFAQIP